MAVTNQKTIISNIITECKKFAANEIRDNALALDLSPETSLIQKIWDKSRQMELPFMPVPDVFNGGGCSGLDCSIILNILANECAGIASIYAYHFTACLTLLQSDSKLQSTLFSKITDQNSHACIASIIFPFPDENNELQWSHEKDCIVVNGISPVTGNLNFSKWFVLFLTDPDQQKEDVCIWIERPVSGMTEYDPLQLPGLKINQFGKITFNNIKISTDSVMAEGKQAREIMKASLSAFYGFIGAIAMGAAHQSFQKAMEYAKSRYQFGKNIIQHQEIQRMLGNMRMKINTGAAAYQQVFEDQQWKLPFQSPDAALAKAFCTDSALAVAMDSIQIHGGYGYMHEYGLEKIMRDIKVLQVIGGTNPYLQVSDTAARL